MFNRWDMPHGLLTEREVAALFALYNATGGGFHAHVPEEAVVSRFRKDFRGYVSEGLDDLARHPEGYVMKHPTRVGMTYQITNSGIEKLKQLRLL